MYSRISRARHICTPGLKGLRGDEAAVDVGLPGCSFITVMVVSAQVSAGWGVNLSSTWGLAGLARGSIVCVTVEITPEFVVGGRCRTVLRRNGTSAGREICRIESSAGREYS